MKTKIYLVSIMAFSLGLTLTAQTSKTNSEQASAEQLTSNSTDNKRVLSRVGGKSVPDNLSAESSVAIKSADISGESERSELLKLAEALSYQARRLKTEAATKSGSEKDKLLSEANQYENNSILKQVKASGILGTICQVKFNSNKESIQKLISTSKVDEARLSRTRSLTSSSDKNMQEAKDLREASYSSNSLSDKLAKMSRAEEKELVALEEQTKAIELLWKK
ncbi:hypothetical protein [Aurantibacillus circumpalustris]|uniref:hypothetical protein n=1 Tax=Aurantibacillus circumpalustris TaxID=3036359 RepID=UPI00295BA56C|nr:hypothetical protein [Aurantibacillus circumpalustris]